MQHNKVNDKLTNYFFITEGDCLKYKLNDNKNLEFGRENNYK